MRWTENRRPDDQRDRDDVVLEPGRVDREALDGAEHRDGGRDRPVRVEKRCADEAHHHEVHAPGPGRDAPDTEQREQRDDAAFAAVVRPAG